jgi:amino acid permease
MPTAGRILPYFFIAFALLGLALGLREWMNPPFTDEQLRASLQDTWEVAASTVPVFAFSYLGLGAISTVLARRAPDAGTRAVAWLAAGLCLLALAVVFRNHVAMTERAAAVTGHEFGTLYGLL